MPRREENAKIMVRTKGLGRILDQVIGRALWREHVDHTANEVQEQPKEVVVDDEVADVEGFPGGLHDTSVLTERPELKLSSHGRNVQKFGKPVIEIEGLVATTRLSPLIACSLGTSDQGLISTFVEKWHKETCSFHFLVGEVTITLDDVAFLLHLPIIGAFHNFKALHIDEAMLLLVELLEAIAAEDYHERKPCAYHWKSGKALPVSTYRKRLDRVTFDGVCWMPYGCLQAIAKRLVRLLNLRIVTEGTKAYNVMEDCLRIAKGVTAECNVYVRSQRRQRIEDT
ncbi:uncharacterized protein LOC114372975 [Glycine soja]|uniref:uncharacterized protein LOC114372975 n=1 Tax=Glycine soja TaxID=3848 RepID=UPI0010394170|nr:uncharacterized protein LOC114372975 [Glycine soja]